MSILIIALPRTGSTELGKRLSLENKLNYVFEPYNPRTKLSYDMNTQNKVVKTVIFHKPTSIEVKNKLNWLMDLTTKFNRTILLSRKDLVACAESWSFYNHNVKKNNFSHNVSYYWEKTSNYDEDYNKIMIWNDEINYLSKELNIPITYYEDIFDVNDANRLRKGNKNKFGMKII